MFDYRTYGGDFATVTLVDGDDAFGYIRRVGDNSRDAAMWNAHTGRNANLENMPDGLILRGCNTPAEMLQLFGHPISFAPRIVAEMTRTEPGTRIEIQEVSRGEAEPAAEARETALREAIVELEKVLDEFGESPLGVLLFRLRRSVNRLETMRPSYKDNGPWHDREMGARDDARALMVLFRDFLIARGASSADIGAFEDWRRARIAELYSGQRPSDIVRRSSPDAARG